MTTQLVVPLRVQRRSGEAAYLHKERERKINKPGRKSYCPKKGLSEILKRLAKQAMAGITECPPLALPHAVRRADDLREIIRHLIDYELLLAADCSLSGKQLVYAATAADFLACLEMTRQTHRAPAFISEREEAMVRMERKLDIIGGAICHSPELLDAFFGRETEAA